jgi:hypothetical protein
MVSGCSYLAAVCGKILSDDHHDWLEQAIMPQQACKLARTLECRALFSKLKHVFSPSCMSISRTHEDDGIAHSGKRV